MSERLLLWHRWLPPRDEDDLDLPWVDTWVRAAVARLTAGGGTVLATVGGTIVASFEPAEVTEALDIARELLDDARGGAGLEVSIGVALGELFEGECGPLGLVVERAQRLAQRAEPGELVLDAGVRARVASEGPLDLATETAGRAPWAPSDALMEHRSGAGLETAAEGTTRDVPRGPRDSLDAEKSAGGALPGEPIGSERDTEPPSPPAPPEGSLERAVLSERALPQALVRAIRERDFEALEDTMRRALVEGGDEHAVERVRALAELVRGDLAAARRGLREARRRAGAPRARDHLAEALLELGAGEPVAGVRAALAALAVSRRGADPRGEEVALRTLAACYRALGREDEASRLTR